MRARRDNAGYSLLEMLAYFAVFAVVVNLAGTLFVSASRLRMLGNEVVERMHALDEIGRRFSDAVHDSDGVAEEAGGYTKSEDTLVLSLPRNRYTVMGRLRGDDRLAIMTFSENAPAEPEFLKTFSHPLETVSFSTNTDGAISMRVQLAQERENGAATHTFVALPRSREGSVP